MSCLPAADVAINLFTPSDTSPYVDIDQSSPSDLTEIVFSPLEILGAASLSIPRMSICPHWDRSGPSHPS